MNIFALDFSFTASRLRGVFSFEKILRVAVLNVIMFFYAMNEREEE